MACVTSERMRDRRKVRMLRAQVAVADEVPLVADELQTVGVHVPLELLVAADRVVLNTHRLAVGDGGLQLGQRRAARAASASGSDGQRRRLGLGEQLGSPLGEAEQRQPQRLRVGETVLEDGEAGGQRRELLGRQHRSAAGSSASPASVHLAGPVGVLFGHDPDAELRQLGAVLVEAPLEGVCGHQRVALDLPRISVASPAARGARAATRPATGAA